MTASRIDLRALPLVRDGLSYAYFERARIEKDQQAIKVVDETGETPVPVASLSAILLGPGTSITHAAIAACADNGASIVWVGEDGVRFYASGLGETRRAANILTQAAAWADLSSRAQVARRMYALRFREDPRPTDSIETLRGREGGRMRAAYLAESARTGVPWRGRSYNPAAPETASEINRALSAAHVCLYGVCHAAIVATGYSPAIGFIHTGRSLAFVYDIADLYKADVTIPAAFDAVRAQDGKPSFGKTESEVRRLCRERIRETRLLPRVAADIARVLGATPSDESVRDGQGALWGPKGTVAGGVNYDDAPTNDPEWTGDDGLDS